MKVVRILLLVIIIIGLGLLATQKFWVPKLVDKIIQSENDSASGQAATLELPTPEVQKPVRQKPPPILSSSTIQIGEFTIQVNCSNLNPQNVEVFKNGSLWQTLPARGSVDGSQKCTQAVVQDVNFDGYTDFMVLTNTGSGGGLLSYWLYSSSTQKFLCPEEYSSCGIMNPKFDPEKKIIISQHKSGASLIIIDTYGVQDGRIILLKTEEVRVQY